MNAREDVATALVEGTNSSVQINSARSPIFIHACEHCEKDFSQYFALLSIRNFPCSGVSLC